MMTKDEFSVWRVNEYPKFEQSLARFGPAIFVWAVKEYGRAAEIKVKVRSSSYLQYGSPVRVQSYRFPESKFNDTKAWDAFVAKIEARVALVQDANNQVSKAYQAQQSASNFREAYQETHFADVKYPVGIKLSGSDTESLRVELTFSGLTSEQAREMLIAYNTRNGKS